MLHMSIPFLFFNPRSTSNSNPNIDNVLNLNGLTRKPISGDGNCFFTSVYYALKDSVDMVVVGRNTTLNLHEISTNDFVAKLRESMVEEWLTHIDQYIGQTTYDYDDYVFEANQFLQDGHFDSELGDTMVICLSNALGVNIILFSDNSTPMQAIRPTRESRIDKPICLVHSSEGVGHYDTAILLRRPQFLNEEANFKKSTKQGLKGCACGKNDKGIMFRCTKNDKYKTRCPCFLNEKECTQLCKCKNCHNGRNREPQTKAVDKTGQKTYETSMEFAAKKGEDVESSLGLNFVEYFLLHEVRQAYPEAPTSAVHNTYNDICHLANMLFVDIPLLRKSEKDIAKGIKSLEINKEILKNVNRNQ